jgi:spore germination protein YaaH
MSSAGSRNVTVVTVISLLLAPVLGKDGKKPGHKLVDRTETVTMVDCQADQACPLSATATRHDFLTREQTKALARTKPAYRVRRGDTISSIARRFDVSATSLRVLNRMRPGARLRPGSIIRIPIMSSR